LRLFKALGVDQDADLRLIFIIGVDQKPGAYGARQLGSESDRDFNDLVCCDPRGVGLNTEERCVFRPQADLRHLKGSVTQVPNEKREGL